MSKSTIANATGNSVWEEQEEKAENEKFWM